MEVNKGIMSQYSLYLERPTRLGLPHIRYKNFTVKNYSAMLTKGRMIRFTVFVTMKKIHFYKFKHV